MPPISPIACTVLLGLLGCGGGTQVSGTVEGVLFRIDDTSCDFFPHSGQSRSALDMQLRSHDRSSGRLSILLESEDRSLQQAPLADADYTVRGGYLQPGLGTDFPGRTAYCTANIPASVPARSGRVTLDHYGMENQLGSASGSFEIVFDNARGDRLTGSFDLAHCIWY